HSFTWTPPYFPGVFDLWDNIFLGRLSSHPWGAMRFIAAVIGGGIMDRYPNLRVGTLECGFGWLPFWGKRMDEQYAYVGSTAELKMKPSEYLKSGRYFCSIERQEGEEMYRMVSDFLGEDVLMYASDTRIQNASSQIRSTTFLPGRALSRKRGRNCSGKTPTVSI